MLRQLIGIGRILSLDVVTGACISTLFIADYLQVNLYIFPVLALGICVWLIYTADHLADAYQVKHPANSNRHLYHQKHFKAIGISFLVMTIIGTVMLFYLPRQLIVRGVVLTGFVGLYFLLISILKPKRFFHKEFIVAFLYATGIFLAPISNFNRLITWDIIALFMQFFLIALINLLEFSLFEKQLDEQDNYVSFTIFYGETHTKKLVYGLFNILFTFILVTSFLFAHNLPCIKAELLIFTMGLSLFLILRNPAFFKKNERYRIVGDSVFLYPLLYLLL